jgi:hypothetical protein
MAPIIVYLDSSDYSLLSDPRRRTSELSALLNQLYRWIQDGRVKCVFSGTHLSEMAPLDSGVADAATRRASLLADLCGRHALVSQERLFEGELRFALGLLDQLPCPFNDNAEWFPEGSADVFPVETFEIGPEIQSTIASLQLNRQARRKAERFAFRGGKPRAKLNESLKKNARTNSLDEILQKYPMRPEDARTLGRYVVGDASAADAREAFLNSLRDPRWMMQWFSQHHGKLTPFIEWIRAPARTMIESFNQVAEHAARLRNIDRTLGTATADELFTPKQWMQWQDETLAAVSMRLLRTLLNEYRDDIQASTIDLSCPGLSTGIRSLHSAWWTATTKTPRSACLSDFPDAMHACYAPYVDVFRADSFMAPYIARQSSRFRTIIVPKLAELVPRLQEILQ